MALTVPWRSLFAGTPGRMRGLALLAALGCLLFGVLSGVAAASSRGAVERAGDDVAQLIRAQRIASDLLAADASASTTYLLAGQSIDRHIDYDRALDDADRLIVEAAAAQPADEQALARLNTSLTRYAALIEHARADNRQGLVVGQQYQRLASDTLRSECLPTVDAIVAANRHRLGGAGTGEVGWPTRQALLQAAAALAALAILIGVSRWLARATHRHVNPALGAATVLVLVGGLLGVLTQVLTVQRLSDFETGPVSAARAAAESRRALYDARAIEGLQLIGQGTGDYEIQWQNAFDRVEVPSNGRGARNAYQLHHLQARRLDADEGRWAAAVHLIADPSRSGFATLNTVVNAEMKRTEANAVGALHRTDLLIAMMWGLPIVGLVAGLLALRGFEPRISEYGISEYR